MNKKSYSKILAALVILNLSFLTAFAENERGEDRNEREDEGIRKIENFCPTLKTNLRKGSHGDEVKNLQKFLKQKFNLSDNDFVVTGTFGKITEKYVKEFQKRNSVSTTGTVGNLTRKKLLENCSTTTLPTTPTPTPVPIPLPATTTTPITFNNKYKDGVYNVTTSYNSPGGLDNLGVSMTLLKDKVVNVIVTNGAKDGTSRSYQNEFIASISSLVIGKNISTLSLGVVSGASLTSRSFNDALNKIRTQALN